MALAAAAAPANAYIADYLPQSLRARAKQIEQKCVLPEIKNDTTASIAAYEVANKEDGLFVRGKAKDGTSWSVKTDCAGLGGSIWTADVDGNGEEDLILLAATGACGIGPPTRILTLLMDHGGKPHPYETVGYSYDADKTGCVDWVRVPGVDGAVLVQQDLTWVTGVKRDRSYWRFHLYQAKDATISRLDGSVAGGTFPTFVWYTTNANHKTSNMVSMLERITRSQQNDAWKETAVEWK
jgi:hypothetical protein